MRQWSTFKGLRLLRQNISYTVPLYFIVMVSTCGCHSHPLLCLFVCVCVCSLLPCRGCWAFKSLEEWSGSAFAFEAGLKERQQTWMLSGQNLVWWDHWLTGDVLLPAPDGRSPTLHQLTVGFTRTFCTKAKRLSWINCNTNPIKLKSLWKHQPKTKECRIKGEIYL